MTGQRETAVAALLLVGLIVSGCSGAREAQDLPANPVASLAADLTALRRPMGESVSALEAMTAAAALGNPDAVRGAYDRFAQEFGLILDPIRLRDPIIAREMALANVALRKILREQQIDELAAVAQAQFIVRSLHQTADSIGMLLTATASAQIGQTGQEEGTLHTVNAREYSFEPTRLEVSKGQQVTVRLQNKGTEPHEWELDGYDVEIRPVKPGQIGEITFVADEAGRFEFACHVMITTNVE